MLFALLGYQFPYSVMNRCFYLNPPPRLLEVFAWIEVGPIIHNPQAIVEKNLQFFSDPDPKMLLAPSNFKK